MSKGQLGDFADDPNSIFVDVPPNPRWILALDLFLSSAAVVGAFLVAKRFGAGTALATAVAIIMGCLVGFKLSLFVKFRKIPRFTLDEFDSVRRAGSRAIAEFRRAHPELPQVGWSLVATLPDGKAISVQGSRGGRIVEAAKTYTVPANNAPVREVNEASYPRTLYCQRLARSDCAVQ